MSEFLNRYKIYNVRNFSKNEWKRFIERKLNDENRDFLLKWSETYKKVDSLSLACEEYERKDYFNKLNLAQSRLMFRSRSRCMPTCRMNYPSDQNNIKALFKCHHCHHVDRGGGSHWLECSFYAKFRISKSLDDDVDLLKYYQQIINLRQSELDQ